MTDSLGKPTVLIVDDDLGFIWWLGGAFGEAGCRVVPAFNCRQAFALTTTLNLEIDLIVVNPGLVGVSEMVEAMRIAHGTITIVAILNGPTNGIGLVHPDATLERPSSWDPISQCEWVGWLREILREVVVRQ